MAAGSKIRLVVWSVLSAACAAFLAAMLYALWHTEYGQLVLLLSSIIVALLIVLKFFAWLDRDPAALARLKEESARREEESAERLRAERALYQAINKGTDDELPSLDPSNWLILRNDERCYCIAAASVQDSIVYDIEHRSGLSAALTPFPGVKIGGSREVTDRHSESRPQTHTGHLLVLNDKVVFSSPGKAFEIAGAKIDRALRDGYTVTILFQAEKAEIPFLIAGVQPWLVQAFIERVARTTRNNAIRVGRASAGNRAEVSR